jgi:hypothetical protein
MARAFIMAQLPLMSLLLGCCPEASPGERQLDLDLHELESRICHILKGASAYAWHLVVKFDHACASI